jgi:hypothetical protein
MNDLEDRGRDLEAFANAQGQPIQPSPRGHALVRATTGLAEHVIGAQPVQVYRDEAKILQKLNALAAAAGPDWFYRFPVKRKDGGLDYIEGPSIKLANDVARIYGNCITEVREIDVGDAWCFYSRFTDIETGFSMERAYRQRKSQTSMKTKDADRQMDIAYQIGQSKGIRNVIVNALQTFADYAFEAARNSLIERIGKDLAGWRARTLEGLTKIPVDVVRVERVIGRASRDWLAPHLAQVIAMMRSIADGMASADEVFPPLEAPATSPAATASPAAGTAQQRQEGGVQSGGGSPAHAEAVHASSTRAEDSSPAAVSAATEDQLALAYEAGREARAREHRRAVPHELRDPRRAQERDSWLRGFDSWLQPTAPDKGPL